MSSKLRLSILRVVDDFRLLGFHHREPMVWLLSHNPANARDLELGIGNQKPIDAHYGLYSARETGGLLLRSPAGLALLALALSTAQLWPSIVEVWTTGAYGLPADAMRLVEVRDLLAGQAWFDLHQYRLDPPAGLDMHWTRVLDVPLALLIKSFSLVVPAIEAERITRIVFPMALLFGFYAAVINTASRLAGPAAMMPAAVIAVLTNVAVI